MGLVPVFDWLTRWMRPRHRVVTDTLPIDPALFAQDGATLYEALATYWAASDPTIYRRHGAGTAVDALEQRYGLRLPAEFCAYLCHAAPASTFMDDLGTQWWGLDDIKALSEECPDWPMDEVGREIAPEADRYLVFADYLLWCYAWAICCSDGPNRGRVALIGGRGDAFVADDFRTFVRLALVDDLALHQDSAQRTTRRGA